MLTLTLFTATTCGYCKPAKKILEEIDDEQVTVNIIEVDSNPANMKMAREWQVAGVPTLVYIKDQQEQARQIGNITKENIQYAIKGYIQRDVFQEQS